MGMGMGPFDDQAITIIMGLDDPMKPGMHGPMKAPAPSDDAVQTIMKIKELCCKFLEGACAGEELCYEGEDPEEHAEEEE